MRQESFEAARVERWRAFEASLARLDAGGDADDFPRQYRLLCQDLLLARERSFGPSLVAWLNQLALRGHEHLYGARAPRARLVELFLREFPRAVRREARLVGALALVFYGGIALAFWLDWRNPELAWSVLGPGQAVAYEQMYDPKAPHYGAPRAASEGVGMFLYYVGNNVSIAFRCFAGGIFAGVGSLFMLLVNAVVIGIVAAHLAQAGYAQTFFSFVIGHGALELTAIVLAAACGLRLGLALVVAGPLPRAAALREAAARTVPILYGATGMLLLAAVVEGLWSGDPAIPRAAKWIAGAALWALVPAWLALGGRPRRAR